MDFHTPCKISTYFLLLKFSCLKASKLQCNNEIIKQKDLHLQHNDYNCFLIEEECSCTEQLDIGDTQIVEWKKDI